MDFYNAHGRESANLTGDLSAASSKLEGYAARLALVVLYWVLLLLLVRLLVACYLKH